MLVSALGLIVRPSSKVCVERTDRALTGTWRSPDGNSAGIWPWPTNYSYLSKFGYWRLYELENRLFDLDKCDSPIVISLLLMTPTSETKRRCFLFLVLCNWIKFASTWIRDQEGAKVLIWCKKRQRAFFGIGSARDQSLLNFLNYRHIQVILCLHFMDERSLFPHNRQWTVDYFSIERVPFPIAWRTDLSMSWQKKFLCFF